MPSVLYTTLFQSVFCSPVVGVEAPPVGHEPGLAVVEERTEEDAVVPVLREVLELAVGQHGLQPRQHQLLRGEVGRAQLVVRDQTPGEGKGREVGNGGSRSIGGLRLY